MGGDGFAGRLRQATSAFCAALSDNGPLVIREQGSFCVGGHKLQAEGVFDASRDLGFTDRGQIFWVDQMYVQYQIPLNPRRTPIVLVHGGSGTGRVWESTCDGREGYQGIFLRRGYPVYIVDVPRRGRSGFAGFNGRVGELDGKQILPNKTALQGMKRGWTRWRLGPVYGEWFANTQFPKPGVDQFFQAMVPNLSDDATVVAEALALLLDRIGPAVVVTHSQSGQFGWATAMRSDKVAAIVSYEPSFAFPDTAVPAPIPLHTGAMPAGAAVPAVDFARMARVPIQICYGDNIPDNPVPDLFADGRRAQIIAARAFAGALNSQGGDVSVLRLPEQGLHGNTHFMFSDLNNVAVADLFTRFLQQKALDKR